LCSGKICSAEKVFNGLVRYLFYWGFSGGDSIVRWFGNFGNDALLNSKLRKKGAKNPVTLFMNNPQIKPENTQRKCSFYYYQIALQKFKIQLRGKNGIKAIIIMMKTSKKKKLDKNFIAKIRKFRTRKC
jgi:hypothetical protein